MVVIALDELLNVCAEVNEVQILAGVNPFSLQRLDKAFATGVVVRVGRSTHAWDHLMLAQDPHVVAGSVLHTAIFF
jgi:hypothetical protein